MQQRVNGMDLNVEVEDGAPHVRVCMGGQAVLDTSALSCTGLQNLAGVLERAAKVAAGELERYWYVLQQQILTAREPEADKAAKGQP